MEVYAVRHRRGARAKARPFRHPSLCIMGHPEDRVILRIAALLYQHPLAVDFRKPVCAIYPAIADHYADAIDSPMDVGTLLKKCLEGKCSAEILRQDLALIFGNSCAFNAGNPAILSLSQHMLNLAISLYEEILERPFVAPNQSSGESTASAFKALVVQKRIERFEFIRHFPMNTSELRVCLQGLQRALVTDTVVSNPLIVEALNKSATYVRDSLDLKEEQDLGEGLSGVASILTFQAFIQPILDVCKEWVPLDLSIAGGSSSGSNVATSAMVGAANLALHILFNPSAPASRNHDINAHSQQSRTAVAKPDEHMWVPRATTHAVLKDLELIFAELAILVQERGLRGVTTSCVWGRPSAVVWAQPARTTDKCMNLTWYPALVLAGGSSTNVHPIYSAVNSSRLSLSTVKALNRLKPKDSRRTESPKPCTIIEHPLVDQSNKRHELCCPDEYVLLEFMGNHDLGWVRWDTLHPFLPESQGELPDAILVTGGKCYSQDILREGLDAACYLEELRDLPPHPEEWIDELKSIPSIEELTKTLLAPTPRIRPLKKSRHRGDEVDGVDDKKSAEALQGANPYQRHVGSLPSSISPANKRKFVEDGVFFFKTSAIVAINPAAGLRERSVLVAQHLGRQLSQFYPLGGRPPKCAASDKKRRTYTRKIKPVSNAAISQGDVKSYGLSGSSSGGSKEKGTGISPSAADPKGQKGPGSSSGKLELKDLGAQYIALQFGAVGGASKVPLMGSERSPLLLGCMDLLDVPTSGSRFLAGAGCLHSRQLEKGARVFSLEDPSCVNRKAILHEEISKLQQELRLMQAATRVIE